MTSELILGAWGGIDFSNPETTTFSLSTDETRTVTFTSKPRLYTVYRYFVNSGYNYADIYVGDDKNVEFTRITNGALDIHWNRTWADIVSLGIELSADGKSMLVSAPTNRTFTIEVYY